jgi:hypothetical protein
VNEEALEATTLKAAEKKRLADEEIKRKKKKARPERIFN